jgi:flagellar hook protein FlgE
MEAVDIVNSKGYSMMHTSDEPGYEKNGFDLSGEPQAFVLDIKPNAQSGDPSATLHYNTETGKNKNVDANDNEQPFALQVLKANYTAPVPATGTTPATPGSITPTAERADSFQRDMDLMVGKSTMYDNKGTSTIKGNAGDYEGNYAGRKVGEMSGVAIAQDGKITATYDNGTSKLLGQIAVANFANPSGLEKIGDNLYQTTPNSGTFDGIGDDITSGSGALSTGVLEMSNVDLSAEFTDMITTQRGFQANSRIITVSDSLLEELTNLKR